MSILFRRWKGITVLVLTGVLGFIGWRQYRRLFGVRPNYKSLLAKKAEVPHENIIRERVMSYTQDELLVEISLSMCVEIRHGHYEEFSQAYANQLAKLGNSLQENKLPFLYMWTRQHLRSQKK